MPRLVQIPLNGSCYNDKISTQKEYLVKVYDNWYAGTFSPQWYGWSFNGWGTSGIQLSARGVTEVYEIIE